MTCHIMIGLVLTTFMTISLSNYRDPMSLDVSNDGLNTTFHD